MHPLNITKVAVGCGEIGTLRARHAARAENGRSWISTRYRPTRAEEVVGGSIFWIVKHQLVARQEILGFAEEDNGHCRILLDAEVIAVRPRPKRAHQGWRYLKGSDAPVDFDGSEGDIAEMPPKMAGALAAMGFI